MMKKRLISWLVSGLMLSNSMFPLIARADSTLATSLSPVLTEIELTPSQQSQLETLSQQTQSQLDNLLTSEQKEQLNNALSQGNDLRTAVRSLNLSRQQRRQMRNIFQTLRSQLNTILTSEQKQQIQESLQR